MSTSTENPPEVVAAAPRRRTPTLSRLLLADRVAVVAAVVLVLAALCAAVGPLLLGDAAQRQDLGLSRLPPLSFDQLGLLGLLGTDPLGRSVLARLVVASATTFSVALPTVLLAMLIGAAVGMWAGFHRGRRETVAMRVADVIMSFPSLLLAVVVLYVFDPGVATIVAVLTITRIPVFLRTARAESAELQRRGFVDAARTFGTPSSQIIRRHVLPVILPTLLTVATLDFCYVTLAESSLSFLGIGIQPPQVSWGLMVAEGRTYLRTAWWLSFFPGLAIVLTTVSATVLSAWVRLATDPAQRWRLTTAGATKHTPTIEGGVA
ncbi:ABC transporter permease [Pseudonocardia kunmingensis]|uniref:Peptide/nickel transport system permease protein n=1 Tax=Pseudonocardia kunmingensis TaxID=630975 RepID=A0A543E412_9PSEU|nr:ABC transporter permease [Pseudonocardia kunmingensis]TQM16312.1 peptide/nickel transport system permease protein [Pseudonocardia kunmingensis]